LQHDLGGFTVLFQTVGKVENQMPFQGVFLGGINLIFFGIADGLPDGPCLTSCFGVGKVSWAGSAPVFPHPPLILGKKMLEIPLGFQNLGRKTDFQHALFNKI